jgi:hypothetical protein
MHSSVKPLFFFLEDGKRRVRGGKSANTLRVNDTTGFSMRGEKEILYLLPSPFYLSPAFYG